MISFRPSEDENAFHKVARNLAEDLIRSNAKAMEEERQIEQKVVAEMKELGFLSLELPEYFDGLELPLMTQVQILQGLSYGDLGVIQGIPDCGDATSVIRVAHKQNVLKHDLKDRTAALINISDETWGQQLTIHSKGSGYELHGISEPVRLAKNADLLLVNGYDDKGKQMILILDDSSQWSIADGDYRLGLLAAGIGQVNFDQAFISNDQVLAYGDDAEKIMSKALTRIQILQAAKEVGLMEAALDYATEYTANRKAFGQEIAKFQGVSFRIAKMAIETRIANHLVWEAAVEADQDTNQAEGLALRALYRAHRSLRFVTDSAVQLLGGHGFIQEFPVEKWMRDAQTQVALYGRELDYLHQWGEKLIGVEQDKAVAVK